MSESASVASVPAPAVLGPIDRESFFEAQRRHRRAARWLAGVVGLGMVLVGVPLASILFPILFMIASVTLDILSVVIPTPNLLGMIDATGGNFAEGPDWLFQLIVLGVIVTTPGILLLLALWRSVWSVFNDGHVADLMTSLGGRAPRLEDAEEKQLANVVDEMAIAAGIRSPQLMLIDGPTMNATAFGASEQTATILVSRKLLEELDRDATQGVIGHLIAGIANGDLRLALDMITGFAAIGLAREMLKAPLGPQGRTLLGQMVHFVLWPNSDKAVAARGMVLERLLSDDQEVNLDEPAGVKKVLFYALLPFLVAYTMFNMVGFAANLLFLSPWLSLLLRRRRYLMDATAVQLTRNPEAFKRALGKLVGQTQPELPPLREGALMFVVPPKIKTKGGAVPMGLFFGIYPNGGKRWERVAAMGAGAVRTPSAIRWEYLLTPKGMLVAGLIVILAGLFAILIPLLLFVIAASTMLSLMMSMIWVILICTPVNWLLR